MSEAGYVKRDETEKRKRGWTAVTVILFILALPVLIPVALGGGAVVLGILLALAGCGLAVILGAGGCVIGGLVCLAVMLFCAVVGAGYGIVMLFSTPASGLAVLGVCLLALGAGMIGCLIVWQAGRFCVWLVRKLTDCLHIQLFQRKKGKAAAASACEEQEENRDRKSVV